MKYHDKPCTIVVTAAVAVNLRKLSQMLDKGDLDGLFTVGLSATGNAPATHFISSGAVPKAYLSAITNNVRLFNIAKKAWGDASLVFPFTQAQVTNALSKCAISDGTYNDPTLVNGVPVGIRDEGPHELIARLGLKFVSVPLP